VFGIGIADRAVMAQRKIGVGVDSVERAVMRQDMHPAIQFT
jgi:hypothetical protein